LQKFQIALGYLFYRATRIHLSFNKANITDQQNHVLVRSFLCAQKIRSHRRYSQSQVQQSKSILLNSSVPLNVEQVDDEEGNYYKSNERPTLKNRRISMKLFFICFLAQNQGLLERVGFPVGFEGFRVGGAVFFKVGGKVGTGFEVGALVFVGAAVGFAVFGILKL
jgi:hypothetical protein